jgi:ubiquinone/menaquinone biosynthesis C-methylase UbiE
VARVDYDREAEHYHAGRSVPLDDLVVWRQVIEPYIENVRGPLLDIGAGTGIWMRALATWFSLPVIGVEPSVGMRTLAQEIGLPAGASMTGGRAEAIPLCRGSVTAAWMSTVVHHITDLDATAAELARVIRPDGAFLIRNSFPGRHDEIMLFSYFPAAKQVADTFPTVEHLTAVFSAHGFRRHDLVRVREPAPDSLTAFRQWALSMRQSDSALSPLTDEQFDIGLKAVDADISRGESTRPLGLDLLAFVRL